MSSNPPPIPAPGHAGFAARLEDQGPVQQVVLTGTADLVAEKELESFLSGTHDRAMAKAASSVVVDMGALEFMNSFCLKRLVSWIFRVRGEPVERQYRIVFRTNPAIQWQRRSVNALACMAPDLVSVTQ